LNQRRGHWLLHDALFVVLAIMGTMRKEYACRVVIVLPFQCCEFDQKIKILYGKMATEVINVLRPFLGCGKTFSRNKIHNIVI
jgi:hypothetical protein